MFLFHYRLCFYFYAILVVVCIIKSYSSGAMYHLLLCLSKAGLNITVQEPLCICNLLLIIFCNVLIILCATFACVSDILCVIPSYSVVFKICL